MKDKKQNWIVRMQCVINKDVYLENCTEAQAWAEPWDYAVDEDEIDQIDWEVKSVEVN